MKIGIIGSFKQYFDEIVDLKTKLQKLGHEITNPSGNMLTKSHVDFVRTDFDNINCADWEIQTEVFYKLFASDFVYVLVINNYIGKTTSYEVGRLIQRKIPLFFSDQPNDLPILVPEVNILDPIRLFGDLEKGISLIPLFSSYENEYEEMENRLIFPI